MRKEISEKYLVQQVMTASPAKLVAMLYDRAIALLREAIDAIEAGNIERRWKANSKATEIVAELWGALDMEQGGEIAANLSRLYGFVTMRLTMVDLENNADAAREVIGLLEPLRDSWHEIADSDVVCPENASDQNMPVNVSVSA